MRPDATGLKSDHADGTRNSLASWSPDGRRIVFVSGRNGFDQIWTMKADGSDMRRLTAPRALDEDPAWSPDGRRIAFVRKFSASRSTIYLIDVDGTNLQALTPGEATTGTRRGLRTGAGSPTPTRSILSTRATRSTSPGWTAAACAS